MKYKRQHTAALIVAICIISFSTDLFAVAFFDYNSNFATPSNAAKWRSSFLNDTAGDLEYVDASGNWFSNSDPGAFGLSYGIETSFLVSDFADNTPAIQAIKNAFAAWDNASATLSFFDAETAPLEGTPSNILAGLNIDIFSAPSDAQDPIWGGDIFGGSTLAVTNVLFFTADQTIATINMYFNEAFNWSATGEAGTYDIWSVALHEIGHAIGFHHPDTADDVNMNWNPDLLPSAVPIAADPTAVMNSTIGTGVLKRTLTNDEKLGLAFLMGDQAGGGEVPEPSTIFLLVPLLVFLFKMRKK